MKGSHEPDIEVAPSRGDQCVLAQPLWPADSSASQADLLASYDQSLRARRKPRGRTAFEEELWSFFDDWYCSFQHWTETQCAVFIGLLDLAHAPAAFWDVTSHEQQERLASRVRASAIRQV
jgi:hypothetical protein